MKESKSTYVSGIRTSPIQYEKWDDTRKSKELKSVIYQPVRQGNKKYTVSPLNQKKKIAVAEDETKLYQQEPQVITQNEISDETQCDKIQESGPILVKKLK